LVERDISHLFGVEINEKSATLLNMFAGVSQIQFF